VNVNFSLREYQTHDVDALRHSYRRGRRAPLYTLPTGGGKTIVFCYIAKNAVNAGRRVLILVHRAELLRQASRALTTWGVPHGRIMPGEGLTGHHVQVASVQTVVRRLARIAAPDIVVVDEAHHAAAATWQKIIDAYPRARLLGVTATPMRLDGKGLGVHAGGYFDDLIIGPSMQELITQGFLVPPRVFASARHLNLAGIATRAGDYARDQLERVMSERAIVGDAVEHYARHCPGKPAIAFCVSLAHADAVAQRFNAAGFRARRIDGAMNDGDRLAVVNDLSSGNLDVMVSVDLVSEGFDVPVCAAAIMLRPTQSEGMYLQQVGRALRPAPGKTSAFILDHAGNCARHGLPQDERLWTLDGRARREAAPEVIQCPSCFAMLPANTRVCPECENTLDFSTIDAQRITGAGNMRTVEQVDGTLIELTPEMIEARRRARAAEVGRAQTLDDLRVIERARGYRRGWAEHVLRARGRRTA